MPAVMLRCLFVNHSPVKSLLLFLLISLHISSTNASDNPDNTVLLAAMEGNPEAQLQLASQYAKNQPEDAVYWYRQAARQGLAQAQFRLGYHLMKGIGTTTNSPQAIYWWKNAALQEHSPSQYNLGRAYHEGIGVEQNTQRALHWLNRAAELGNQQSIAALALLDVPTKAPTVPMKTVFAEADKNSLALTQLSETTHLDVLQEREGWQQVLLTDTSILVWCYKSFVRINDDQTVTFTGDKVRARQSPEISPDNIVREIRQGQTYELIQQNDKWVQIQLHDLSGWISTETANNADQRIERKQPLVTKKYNYQFKNRRDDNDWLFNIATEHFSIIISSVDHDDQLLTTTNTLAPVILQQTKQLTSKRQGIEWRHLLYGNFTSKEAAITFAKDNQLDYLAIASINELQQQRCISWKRTIPIPAKLKSYCL